MTLIIRRSGKFRLNISAPAVRPTWFQNALNAAAGTGLTTGLPLYQWYKLANHAAAASGRPNSYWSKNPHGSETGLIAPGEVDPDLDFRADPAFPGFNWQHVNFDSITNNSPGHYEPRSDKVGNPPVHETVPNVTNYVSRLIDSSIALRRQGSVLLLRGSGHNCSWRNDVAEIHLGDNNLLRQVVTPPTPYDMIRYCNGPGSGGNGTHPQHDTGGWHHSNRSGIGRFRAQKFLDGRPIQGHCGFKTMYNDEADCLIAMGTGVMDPGAGAGTYVEAWQWATKDWDKPLDYVSPTNTGAGMPRYGETHVWPGISKHPNNPGRVDFSQPMVKLTGQNTIIMACSDIANETPIAVWSYSFPGPNFTRIGQLNHIHTFAVSGSNFPIEHMVHDPILNRILMLSNYVSRASIGLPSPAGTVEGDYQYARVGYIDLNLVDGSPTTNLYVPISEATYNSSAALRARTPGDPMCYDENGNRYLVWFTKGGRDPRSNIALSGAPTYASNGGLAAGYMPFNKLYSINPSTFASSEITVTPDPVYGVPPGNFRGTFRQCSYMPELKAVVYVADAVDRINPTVTKTSSNAYGLAGGTYVWIMRVG